MKLNSFFLLFLWKSAHSLVSGIQSIKNCLYLKFEITHPFFNGVSSYSSCQKKLFPFKKRYNFRGTLTVFIKKIWYRGIIFTGVLLIFLSSIDLTHLKPISHHIETSRFICTLNQLTGFYIMGTSTFNELKPQLLMFSNLAYTRFQEFLVHTHVCVLGVRNVSFSENLVCFVFL